MSDLFRNMNIGDFVVDNANLCRNTMWINFFGQILEIRDLQQHPFEDDDPQCPEWWVAKTLDIIGQPLTTCFSTGADRYPRRGLSNNVQVYLGADRDFAFNWEKIIVVLGWNGWNAFEQTILPFDDLIVLPFERGFQLWSEYQSGKVVHPLTPQDLGLFEKQRIPRMGAYKPRLNPKSPKQEAFHEIMTELEQARQHQEAIYTWHCRRYFDVLSSGSSGLENIQEVVSGFSTRQRQLKFLQIIENYCRAIGCPIDDVLLVKSVVEVLQ